MYCNKYRAAEMICKLYNIYKRCKPDAFQLNYIHLEDLMFDFENMKEWCKIFSVYL